MRVSRQAGEKNNHGRLGRPETGRSVGLGANRGGMLTVVPVHDVRHSTVPRHPAAPCAAHSAAACAAAAVVRKCSFEPEFRVGPFGLCIKPAGQ